MVKCGVGSLSIRPLTVPLFLKKLFDTLKHAASPLDSAHGYSWDSPGCAAAKETFHALMSSQTSKDVIMESLRAFATARTETCPCSYGVTVYLDNLEQEEERNFRNSVEKFLGMSMNNPTTPNPECSAGGTKVIEYYGKIMKEEMDRMRGEL